jgi:M6 family metalloprotease-like protein
MIRRLEAWCLTALAIMAAACAGDGNDSGTSTPPVRVLTSITVSVSPAAIQPGQTATAAAVGRDQTGAVIPTAAVTWSSSASSVATVNGSGVIAGVASGQTLITATSGGTSGSASLTVIAGDVLAACRLPRRFNGAALGFPRAVNRLPTVGTVRATVLFTDFSDAVASRTPQNAFALISPIAENYYRAVSYGKMNLILEPSYVWLRMSKPSTGYGWDGLTFAAQKAYIQEAIALAGSSVNYSASDAIVVISNPDAGALSNGPAFVPNPGDGVTAGGRLIESAATSGRDLLAWGAYWLNHEMGHTMGLADLYSYSGTVAAQHHFVGVYSMMGLIAGPAREYFAWERWNLGWLADDQVTCAQPGVTTATLTPVERVSGLKMVVVPVGPTTAVVVESRRIEGYDGNGFTPGILVYYIDTSIASGAGELKVLPINDADTRKLSAPLGIGQSLTFGDVTVTFVSQDSAGDHVRVTR